MSEMKLLVRILFLLLWLTAATLPARAVSFTNDIAPILVQKCLSCHGAEKNKGGYRLDTFAWLLKPGSSKETPIVPGKPDSSKLYQLLITTDEEDRMPQKNEPLPNQEVEQIKRWISEGGGFDGPSTNSTLITIIPPLHQPDPPEVYPHPIPITALAFSPNGSELAASGYHEITIWSATNGKLLRRIKNVAQSTLCLAYSPDGSLLAAAGGTPGRIGEVKLFKPASGELSAVLATSTDVMLAVAFRPDGAKLAAGGSDNRIQIFDLSSNTMLRWIEQHSDWVTSLAFSHDGKLLASASRDKSARIYEAKIGAMEHSYLGHGDFVYGVGFSPDDQRVWSCGRDRKVHYWKTTEEKKSKSGEVGSFEGEVLKLIVTSNAVFSCSTDGFARQHSTDKTPELIRTFSHNGQPIYALALDETHHRLATGSHDGKIRIWDIYDGKEVLMFTAAPGMETPH
ncbi:MAG TPA: c-type cytochrome domain-containing protein [Candidatus Saccharimonadales bacterium]|nr:c-type cytochrome domain-containing protein [Candidatus Saccharimonadales bacterium]